MTLTQNLVRTWQAFYAICLATIGILQLYYADFRSEILPPLPPRIPGLAICARLVGVALVVSALALLMRMKATMVALVWGGILLAFIPIFHVPYMLLVSPHPNHLGSWVDTFNTLALAGMGFVVAGSFEEPSETGEPAPVLLRHFENIRFPNVVLLLFGHDGHSAGFVASASTGTFRLPCPGCRRNRG